MKTQIEFESTEKIKALQNIKLKEMLRRVADKSSFYKSQFKECNIDILKINSIDDLHVLPFTSKEDLAANNDDFLCVPKNTIKDYVTTSGSLGEPVAFYLTAKDLNRLAYNEALSLSVAKGTENDVYQLMTTLDKQFIAGIAYYKGVQKLGAGIVRVGPGSPYLQWDSIKRFSPTVLIAIPSFIPKIIEYATENNIDYKNSSVKSIICIGEPIRKKDFSYNELGKRITSNWDVKLYSTYASTEMGVAFTECEHAVGGHYHPELILLEVIDEENNKVLDGEIGEVVITTLEVEGMPLIRYRTGDLCSVHYAPCKCGRTTTRLGPVVGRKKQMIKFKGTTIFPPAIFDVLELLPEITIYQVEVSKNEFGNDTITIVLSEKLNTKELIYKLTNMFKSKLRVSPFIIFENDSDLNKKVFRENQRKPEKIIYLS
jgi:phenylacetate-CoA ligase